VEKRQERCVLIMTHPAPLTGAQLQSLADSGVHCIDIRDRDPVLAVLHIIHAVDKPWAAPRGKAKSDPRPIAEGGAGLGDRGDREQ
jgi:hypothetical protein